MIILSFSYWNGAHDAAAAIVVDGRIVAAAEEERFSREKHDGNIPVRAIRYCLAAAGVDMRDVDVLAYPDRPFRTGRDSQLAEMTWTALRELRRARAARSRSLLHKAALEIIARSGIAMNGGMNSKVESGFSRLREEFGELPSVKYFGHHLAHAAAAVFTSGFDAAAISTIDGRGGPFSSAIWSAEGTRIRLHAAQPYTNSLGWFYRDVTRFVGLGDFGEGKLMGLAPYGNVSDAKPRVQRLLRTGGNSWYRYEAKPVPEIAGFERRNGELVTAPPYSDFAAATQQSLEHAASTIARAAVNAARSRNLCLGGGVALNCSANGRLLADGIADDIWVFPAAGDAGLPVGAALLAAREEGELIAERLAAPYLGPAFSDSDIERALRSEPGIQVRRPPDVHVAAAELIAAGSIVGWFQGRMELGPRALGNRSILADPRNAAIRDRVNEIKGREKWRPLAPAVLVERVDEYFSTRPSNDFMLFAVQATAKCRTEAPPIVHVDGSARPQLVRRETNAAFHALISEFNRQTGVPILLNTSFNRAGEPIVCDPADALRTFTNSGLDALVIGPFVVNRCQ
jgi:carbamoyltransferase